MTKQEAPSSVSSEWQQILEHVRSQVPQQTFRTWFEPLTASHRKNSTLYVQAPSATFRAWHGQESAALIASALAQLEGLGLHSVEFVVPENKAALPGLLLSDVKPSRVEWLWEHRIPLGKITILDGDPDVGKSLLTLELAARVTQGKPLPGNSRVWQSGAVILSAEDSLSDTIRPRLEAAKADLSKVAALHYSPETSGEQTVSNIAVEVPTLEGAIRKVNAKLVIVDVLAAYFPSETNTFRDQDVRLAMMPLTQLAERQHLAIICIRHFTKGGTGNPLHRGGGSIGIIAGPRAGIMIARDPKDPTVRILAQTKSNLGPPMPSLAFRIRANDQGVPFIVWKGQSEETAGSLLAATAENVTDRTLLAEAKQLLLRELSGGSRRMTDLHTAWRAAGISDRTMRRARVALGVKTAQKGVKGRRFWTWQIAPQKPVP